MFLQEVKNMTAQLKDETHKLYSYTDKNGHYCEVWGSDEDVDPYDTVDHSNIIDDIASYFTGFVIES